MLNECWHSEGERDGKILNGGSTGARVCITPNSEDYSQKDAYRKGDGPSNRPPFGRRHERKLFCFALPVKALPPLLVSFDAVEELVAALPATTRISHEQKIRDLVAQGLPPAVSLRTIATIFGVSPSLIAAMYRKPSRYYRHFKIKKGKKVRSIQAPKIALKVIQAWFGGHIARSTELPNCVLGFVPGRSGVKEAAKYHCRATWVYSLDIRNFFPSITELQVCDAIARLGYSDNTAAFLSKLMTLDGYLPQGSPASPVLSNWVFAQTDAKLIRFATANDIRYTRYADDLVFSGLESPPENLASSVREIVTQDGWTIADDKEHLARLPTRLKVHGLLVHGQRPRLTKGYRNRIRAYRHLLSTNKIDAKDLDKVLGHITYAAFIEDQ